MPETLDYRVEEKREFRQANKAGVLETWYHIFATSKGGTYFHIDVKETDLEKAAELLTKRAQALDKL